jgi:hypothetical protein
VGGEYGGEVPVPCTQVPERPVANEINQAFNVAVYVRLEESD